MSTIAERLRTLHRDAGLRSNEQTVKVTPDAPNALSVIPAEAGIQFPLGKIKMDPGVRRDDEQEKRLALRAICNANVRAGIPGSRPAQALPSQSGVTSHAASVSRRDDEQKNRGTRQLDALRRLMRARKQPPGTMQPRRVLMPPAGEEIAPGLHHVEAQFAYPASATLAVPAIDEAPLDRRRLLCFDTETTGLAGGVGTRAFMIGVAAWSDGLLTVRQLYLTAIAGERAMLKTFADWLEPETILVSYNGKSYDAPLLKGRLRLNRVEHRLAELPHIDWLHPTRRVYKGHLANCKLATIEREVLRIIREDDLPGSEAPAAWLAYLRGQSSVNLGRVLDHNRQDVITLMRLGDHLTSLHGA